MPAEYEKSTELETAIQTVLDTPTFDVLRTHSVKIASCFKIVTDADGEFVAPKGSPVQLKRVGQPAATFIPDHYILVFDSYTWNNFSGKRAAYIHKALMSVKVTINGEGVVKFGLRSPTVQEFTQTLIEYGAYNPELEEMVHAAQATTSLAHEGVQ